MKKAILFFAVVGLIAVTAMSTPFTANATINKNTKSFLINEKYKACIDACNACVTACKNCESMCSKDKDAKMAKCIQLCKECVSICTASSQLMRSEERRVGKEC